MIIIPSHVSRINTWLKDCLTSLDTKHPITVVFQGNAPLKMLPYTTDLNITLTHSPHDGFDPGGIVWAREHCKDPAFFLLHDSCVIKDNALFDICFTRFSSESVALADRPVPFGMFLGKYKTRLVKDMLPPIATSKLHAVELEETWNNAYCILDQPVILTPPLRDNDVFEEKYGRKNMVLENPWVIKYKGTWNRNML